MIPLMGRANRVTRGWDEGGLLHVTHRCHNRAFLLKFVKDRNAYREKLREHAERRRVWVLDYCITSNHVHLLLETQERVELSRFMQDVASEMARAYNRRKHRVNAFWGDNYHATRVESGRYLWECICYIELNMNRCGVVRHPREWDWAGYREIMGLRRRYRVIDLDRLCWRLGAADLNEVRRNLAASLAERIARDGVNRQGMWTESLAVGSEPFVETQKRRIPCRRVTTIETTAQAIWTLKEMGSSYRPITVPKSGPKAPE